MQVYHQLRCSFREMPASVHRVVGPAARLLHRLLRSAEEVRDEQKPPRQRLRGATPLMLAAVLPFEPQPLPRRGRRWFEGWFVRIVDHARATSVALVLGSLRLASETSDTFSEHLITVAWRDASGHHETYSLLLPGDRQAPHSAHFAHLSQPISPTRDPHVTHMSEPISPSDRPIPFVTFSVSLRGGASVGGGCGGAAVEWWSRRHGGLRACGDEVEVDISTGVVHLRMNVSTPRLAWSPGARADTAGNPTPHPPPPYPPPTPPLPPPLTRTFPSPPP